MYDTNHNVRNGKGRFTKSANPSKDALRKRRARAAARKGLPVAVARKGDRNIVLAPKYRSADGTVPSAAQAVIFASQRFSFAPNYVRKGDVKADGGIKANVKNPSRRRFGTEAEAKVHAARFVIKNGHIGSFITKVYEKPTSWVNEKTGLTNELV